MKDTTKRRQDGSKGPVIWAGVFIALILLLSAVNARLLPEIVELLDKQETDFKGFVEQVQTAYTEKFLGKKYFININGLYYRTTGRRVLNEIIRLKNGMLTSASMLEQDIGPMADNIGAFSDYLAEEGIPLLYVQPPFKIDDEGLLLPPGRSEFVNRSVDNLLDRLHEMNVRALDLRPYLSATPELLERNYFKTDHHWNYTGAFTGFQRITEAMSELMPDKRLDLSYTDLERWDSHTLKNWFLGSRGKRVGQFFGGGVDDIVYYTPRFETNMSCSAPNHSQLFKGDFSAANIRSRYLENKDYFGDNAYCLYIGGDYPLVQHRNYDAPNDLKVLMIKDSFTLPVQAYMSTLFQEVDVIDPRHFTECSVAEYAENMRPDIVIMMIYPGSFGWEVLTDFGMEAAIEKRNVNCQENIVMEAQTVQVDAEDSDYNRTTIASGLEYNKTYIIRFEDISFTQGESGGVTVALYNADTKTIIASRTVDVEYCKKTGGFEWAFNTPAAGDGNLHLLLYSGMWGSTAGIAATYRSVQLKESQNKS